MQVIEIEPCELKWSFNGQQPHVSVGLKSWQTTVNVDPFPAYAPKYRLVRTLAEECWRRFPMPDAKLGIYILPYEFTERMNGWASNDTDWNDKVNEERICYCGCGQIVKFESRQVLTISLSAKRIPIHPAMVRYLVTHEYGHCASYYLARKMGFKDGDMWRFEQAYMSLRGSPRSTKHYGGGTWHLAASEIIANDFRTIVMGQELEFWPHEVPQLGEDSPVGKFWGLARDICGT